MSLSRRQEWLVRGCLVVFGVLVALGGGALAYMILKQRAGDAGTEFANLQGLRDSLARADARAAGTTPVRVTLGSIIQAHPDEQMIYDLRPNLSLIFQGAAVRTNSCGMREREIGLVKPPGTYRIAIIGDSFTFGWGVEEQEAFPRQLEVVLNAVIARLPATTTAIKVDQVSSFRPRIERVEVLNFGVPGYSPFQEVATFETKALAYDPDAVILFFIENDFGMPFFIRDLDQPQNLFASANLQKLARAALQDDDESTEPPPAPKLPPEFDPNRALSKLARIADEHGVRVFLAINPKKNWVGIHKRLWILRNTHQIRFMNLHSDFERMIEARGYTKESLTLPRDQHPSARKHRMLAEAMAPYFLADVSPF